MATIVLGALGTLAGGPLGGAIGALLGRQVDAQIIGSPVREGARLKDLAISTSSYGQPIARHFGRVRAAGTVIWATDLKEHRDVEGGGKGRPRTVSYSYSVSLAVALASRPIDRVGRIWADGNLLRGAADDLKTGGVLRVYTGHGDQQADPLMETELGEQCPAHRGCAYAVFEDLDLTDFGNRIPALSFEIFAGAGSRTIEAMIEDGDSGARGDAPFPELLGFSHEGGSLAQVAALVDRLHPIVPRARDGAVTLVSASDAANQAPRALPPPAISSDGESGSEFGREEGKARARRTPAGEALAALRYYDIARDYQPGLQRPEGAAVRGGAARIFEFPGTLAADDARALARSAAARDAGRRDTLAWRLAELDPELEPGTIVRAPGEQGLWRIAAWEWRDGGIELQLLRHAERAGAAPVTDSGSGWTPPDRLPQPSLLRVFEAPWDGFGDGDARRVYAAIGAPTGRWAGAALYLEREGRLVATGQAARERAVGGFLETSLARSSAMLFEPVARAVIALADADAELRASSIDGLAAGENRMLVGREVIQFAAAESLGEGRWEISGLLRGRGGTEAEAGAGHPSGTQVTLLDDRTIAVRPEILTGSSAQRFGAIGQTDDEPVFAVTENAGASRKPPTPVHPRISTTPDGGQALSWTRRARGGWAWLSEVEQPLVEQMESYEVGLGPVDAPYAVWSAQTPQLTLAPATRAALAAAHPDAALWVRQRGSYAKSDALLLGAIA